MRYNTGHGSGGLRGSERDDYSRDDYSRDEYRKVSSTDYGGLGKRQGPLPDSYANGSNRSIPARNVSGTGYDYDYSNGVSQRRGYSSSYDNRGHQYHSTSSSHPVSIAYKGTSRTDIPTVDRATGRPRALPPPLTSNSVNVESSAANGGDIRESRGDTSYASADRSQYYPHQPMKKRRFESDPGSVDALPSARPSSSGLGPSSSTYPTHRSYSQGGYGQSQSHSSSYYSRRPLSPEKRVYPRRGSNLDSTFQPDQDPYNYWESNDEYRQSKIASDTWTGYDPPEKKGHPSLPPLPSSQRYFYSREEYQSPTEAVASSSYDSRGPKVFKNYQTSRPFQYDRCASNEGASDRRNSASLETLADKSPSLSNDVLSEGDRREKDLLAIAESVRVSDHERDAVAFLETVSSSLETLQEGNNGEEEGVVIGDNNGIEEAAIASCEAMPGDGQGTDIELSNNGGDEAGAIATSGNLFRDSYKHHMSAGVAAFFAAYDSLGGLSSDLSLCPWWTQDLKQELSKVVNEGGKNVAAASSTSESSQPSSIMVEQCLHLEISAFAKYLEHSEKEKKLMTVVASKYLSFLEREMGGASFMLTGSRHLGVSFPWDPIQIAVVCKSDGPYVTKLNTNGHQSLAVQSQTVVAVVEDIESKLAGQNILECVVVTKPRQGSLVAVMKDVKTNVMIELQFFFSYNMALKPPEYQILERLIDPVRVPQLRALTLLIRRLIVTKESFAKGFEGLDSYSITLWVISFLRVHPFLYDETEEDAENKVDEDPFSLGGSVITNLGALFLDFCHLFGKVFDYASYGLAPNALKPNDVIFPKIDATRGAAGSGAEPVNVNGNEAGSGGGVDDGVGAGSGVVVNGPNYVRPKPYHPTMLTIRDPMTQRKVSVITKQDQVEGMASFLSAIFDRLCGSGRDARVVGSESSVGTSLGSAVTWMVGPNAGEVRSLLAGLVSLTESERGTCESYDGR
ncbi:hypothetical protein HDU76_002369, partial [Blyttiomyces sp. JEL0837]